MAASVNVATRRFDDFVDSQLIQTLMKHYVKGDKLLFARRHNGQIKVKIKHGLAKLREKRFVTNNETFEEIKKHLRLS